MAELGFERPRAYMEWCRVNGFVVSVYKDRADLFEERQAFEQQKARRRAHERLHKNPKAFLEAVCLGQLRAADIERPNFKMVAREIEESNPETDIRRSLLDMLVTIHKRDTMVFHAVPGDVVPFVRGLIKLHDRKALWLRPLETWRPKRKSPERRFGELTHHLFDRYGDVPRFMERVWLRADRSGRRYRDWYVHLGRGHNLRTAKSPVPLTKKAVHNFLRAPDDYSVEQAIRWGQMAALSAREASIHATVATRLGRSFSDEEFWITVLRFIADNPMLDPRQIGPLIDYLQHQRFEPTEIELAPGVWRQAPPPQPGLSMSGRTVGTLMRQMEAWHHDLGKQRNLPGGQYARADFAGMLQERDGYDGRLTWSIRQLRNARALQIEGDDLHHCVASYHWSCARGACTIWSLAASPDGTSFHRRQTIEVVDHTIVQCRGLANRDPDSEEWSVVTAWAQAENLKVARRL